MAVEVLHAQTLGSTALFGGSLESESLYERCFTE